MDIFWRTTTRRRVLFMTEKKMLARNENKSNTTMLSKQLHIEF